MKEIVKAINEEIKTHEAEILKLAKARSVLEGYNSTKLHSTSDVEKLVAPRSRSRSTKKIHRTQKGVMREAILTALGKQGTMSVRNVVEGMRIDGYQFYRGSNRNSSVGSCLRRMERRKLVGVIKEGNNIVYTTKAEVFHPGSKN